ncbi:12382_t:CDS:2, partial [Funneliformis geosporum]
GVILDVDERMFKDYPNQFAPFRIPCENHYNGTLFRYPLRTEVDSTDSEISDRIYKPDAILEMFDKFYEHESIDSLLFIKYIERISFYEIKNGANELELLYTIQLENADEVREKRRLIAKNIGPMMNLLKSGELKGNNQLDTSYIATFCRQKGDSKENSSWLILNYLDDLLETEKYFQNEFKRSIGDHKFIPNVGLAVPINDLMIAGSLFCFLPLPISTPFPVSVHGYFADCYYKEHEYLVCLVAPILDYNVKDENFLKHLGWNTYPDVRTVLEQLELCYVRSSNGQSPENLKEICNAIYKYMYKAFQKDDKEEFEIMKNDLENKPWIWHNDAFYSADKFVFRLPTEFEDNNSLIVELPPGYISDFKSLFEAMGVRNEIGVKELILIINNMVEGNEERKLSDDEINHNADDAKATNLSVIVDERPKFQHSSKMSLLTKEMDGWQVGFNCAYHLTDLPSIVSREYIIFFDPNEKYLPAQGRPPKRKKGFKINFMKTKFKESFPDQCYPYEALDCNFNEIFNGTLFRLPLRTDQLASDSKITNHVVKIEEILQLFNGVQGNKEMLFLRNIELCSLRHINDHEQVPQPIWQAQIYMSDDHRDIRKSVTDCIQTYQLDIKIEINDILNSKISEIWLLCIGGHERIRSEELENISRRTQIKFPNPPELKGEIFSYLPLSISTNLGVHLNGNFSLSSSRSNVLQFENDVDHKRIIPNNSLNAFVLASTLYDSSIHLFLNTFADKNKFLPPELQNDPVCLEALGRIGLKNQVNSDTYIECAQEIAQEIVIQINQARFPANEIEDRAKTLVLYLYEHVNSLNFNEQQWEIIIEMKFVPSEKNLSPFYYEPKVTTGSSSETEVTPVNLTNIFLTTSAELEKNPTRKPNQIHLQQKRR